MNDDRGFLETLLGDGRPLLVTTALVLIGSGVFATFQAATGQLLPHDTLYLGMAARDICALKGCRILHFMIHDRVSFGGVLVGIGVMYLWLSTFPLGRREAWAWWALAISGSAGFLSFLAYLGYGYLDRWHGAATVALLPLFAVGVWRTHPLARDRVERPPIELRSRQGLGRLLLLLSTFGIIAGGLTIMTVGMTAVFVPQDLEFMGLAAREIRAINPNLIPLIAHDRAGFGGALVSCGLAMFASVLYGRPSRNLTQALAFAGLAGFGTTLVVHPAIGYLSATHLGPAVFGCLVYVTGLVLARPSSVRTDRSDEAPGTPVHAAEQ